MEGKLYYSPVEKILFYVAGYTDNGHVKHMISVFVNNYEYLQKISGVKEIKTILVEQSSRYKGMRVFFCETENPPADAFRIEMHEYRKEQLLESGYTEDQIEWTMMKWLQN